eukprot:6192258-Pleurochrysis_carterae.AAC.4
MPCCVPTFESTGPGPWLSRKHYARLAAYGEQASKDDARMGLLSFEDQFSMRPSLDEFPRTNSRDEPTQSCFSWARRQSQTKRTEPRRSPRELRVLKARSTQQAEHHADLLWPRLLDAHDDGPPRGRSVRPDLSLKRLIVSRTRFPQNERQARRAYE